MDFKECIRAQWGRVDEMNLEAIKDLTLQELLWRPEPHCPSIAIIFFHQARWQDQFLHSRLKRIKDIWETQGWYTKFNMPVGDKPGVDPMHTEADLAAFQISDIRLVRDYDAAARAELEKFLEDCTESDMQQPIKDYPYGKPKTIGEHFATGVMHLARHCGEMLYLRRVQKGFSNL